MSDYMAVNLILENRYEEISGDELYMEIFSNNERSGEEAIPGNYKPNGIFLYWDEDTQRQRRRIMLSDTWQNDYINYVEMNERALCAGLAFRGKTNRNTDAAKLNALIVDLDDVGSDELLTFLARAEQSSDIIRSIPTPTYIASSGTGLHIYYLLNEPIDMLPGIIPQLKALKHDLTWRIWDPGCTSKKKKIEYQPVNHTFRMVGSVNEKYNTVVRGYRTGKPVSISYLNNYVKHPVDLSQKAKRGNTALEIAAQKWPEWYQRRIVEGKSCDKWRICDQKGHKGDELYQWWLRQLEQIQGGHRYYFMMCAVVYASKCDVPYETVKADLEKLFPVLAQIKHVKDGVANELHPRDLKNALKIYKRDFYNLKLEDIENLCGVTIKRNKRNGRPQKIHLGRIRALQNFDDPEGNWRNKDGRPVGSGTKKEQIKQWRAAHPDGRKIDCERDLGVSRPTIIKWWENESEE